MEKFQTAIRELQNAIRERFSIRLALLGVLLLVVIASFKPLEWANAKKYPVAARTKQGHKQDKDDRITAKLPALHFYQLALPTPKPAAGSFDRSAAERGEKIFVAKATPPDWPRVPRAGNPTALPLAEKVLMQLPFVTIEV